MTRPSCVPSVAKALVFQGNAGTVVRNELKQCGFSRLGRISPRDVRMYGLFIKAIENLMLVSAGDQVWEQVKADSGHEALRLENTERYDDEVALDLITAASRILDMPVETFLFELGRHWVTYTNENGWPNHFRMDGRCLVDCLRGLDEMHQRVKDAMPDASMPEFHISEWANGFYLEYSSSRKGFAPMVHGILYGLCDHFEESWEIDFPLTHESESTSSKRFVLRRINEKPV